MKGKKQKEEEDGYERGNVMENRKKWHKENEGDDGVNVDREGGGDYVKDVER